MLLGPVSTLAVPLALVLKQDSLGFSIKTKEATAMVRTLRSGQKFRSFLGFAAISFSGWLLASVDRTSAQEASSGQQKLPQPLVNTHDLMELFNEPLYKSLQKSLRSAPGDDEWTSIREDATRIAEVANLVAIREMSDRHPRWDTLSKSLQDIAFRLAESADSKDYQSSRAIFAATIKQCNQCHQEIASGRAPQLEAFSE